MKKTILYLLIFAMLASLPLAGCGLPEFGKSVMEVTENSEKRMVITVSGAGKDAALVTGSLEAGEGDEIVITAALEKGSVRVEIMGTPEEQSIDEIPDFNGEAILTASLVSGESMSGTVPAGSYLVRATCLDKATGTVTIEVKSGKGAAGDIDPDVAKAYAAVMDEFAEHLGWTVDEASEGECLQSAFLRDFDGDGTPELCLLLFTSPRRDDSWEGTPLYGWYAPTLYLITYRNGGAVLTGQVDLYFSTAGREAEVALMTGGDGAYIVCRDVYTIEEQSFAARYELIDGELKKTELTEADAEDFAAALEDGSAQLLMFNRSGEAGIALEANAKELRDSLAEEEAEEASTPVVENGFTEEQAMEAIMNYCFEAIPGLEEMVKAGDAPVYWDVTTEDGEIIVLYRAYTGAQIRYHVDPATGETYSTQFVPGISAGEERSDETFNIRDYME